MRTWRDKLALVPVGRAVKIDASTTWQSWGTRWITPAKTGYDMGVQKRVPLAAGTILHGYDLTCIQKFVSAVPHVSAFWPSKHNFGDMQQKFYIFSNFHMPTTIPVS